MVLTGCGNGVAVPTVPAGRLAYGKFLTGTDEWDPKGLNWTSGWAAGTGITVELFGT